MSTLIYELSATSNKSMSENIKAAFTKPIIKEVILREKIFDRYKETGTFNGNRIFLRKENDDPW